LANNGKLYGTTEYGGDGYGTIFEVNPFDGKITTVANFNGINGQTIRGNMVLAPNGLLYGVTQNGTTNSGWGVLYQFNPTNNTITKLKDFYDVSIYLPQNLMLASNGKLYGTSASGGAKNYGALFEYDIANNTVTKKADFDATVTGNSPAQMIQANNGILYGTCFEGGNNGKGTIYSYNINTNTLATLAHFGANLAERPIGSLLQAPNGKFYGMSIFYNSDPGTIYEFDAVGNNIAVKFNFVPSIHGYGGYGELIKGGNGKLYCMSAYKNSGYAQVLEYDYVKDTVIIKSSVGGSTEGSLVQAKSTNLSSLRTISQKNRSIIYPNPANNYFNIKTDNLLNVKIYAADGKLILTTAESHINTTALNNGIYWVVIQNNQGIATHQLMIER
jgi:uncharacterized repeat protein (TIGR03803 family)